MNSHQYARAPEALPLNVYEAWKTDKQLADESCWKNRWYYGYNGFDSSDGKLSRKAKNW